MRQYFDCVLPQMHAEEAPVLPRSDADKIAALLLGSGNDGIRRRMAAYRTAAVPDSRHIGSLLHRCQYALREFMLLMVIMLYRFYSEKHQITVHP